MSIPTTASPKSQPPHDLAPPSGHAPPDRTVPPTVHPTRGKRGDDPADPGRVSYGCMRQFHTAAANPHTRPTGHLPAEKFIKNQFNLEAARGNFETDQFTPNTPAGPQTMRNYIAKFPGKK